MKVTVVEHEAEAPLGFLAEWMEGVEFEVVRPYLGDPVPERAADGLIVLGGAMAAWEDEDNPWLPATRALIATAVRDGVPTLGICLGAQLMALACGGAAARGGNGLEIGACAVRALPAAADDAIFSSLTTAVTVHYHQDAITALPAGATLLATGAQYPIQAFRLGDTAWGVQFHPEATPEIFASWTPDEELNLHVRNAEPELRAAWRPVAEAFAAQIHHSIHAHVRGHSA
ncbi:type 1 glutamine amidotransferase [Streptosporangiaceae bacterium NEAU-GS5]|nr:type 1 glutamine amidotransferase [Streptosporangiaceae bacterium NEAU-GS5]